MFDDRDSRSAELCNKSVTLGYRKRGRCSVKVLDEVGSTLPHTKVTVALYGRTGRWLDWHPAFFAKKNFDVASFRRSAERICAHLAPGPRPQALASRPQALKLEQHARSRAASPRS